MAVVGYEAVTFGTLGWFRAIWSASTQWTTFLIIFSYRHLINHVQPIRMTDHQEVRSVPHPVNEPIFALYAWVLLLLLISR